MRMCVHMRRYATITFCRIQKNIDSLRLPWLRAIHRHTCYVNGVCVYVCTLAYAHTFMWAAVTHRMRAKQCGEPKKVREWMDSIQILILLLFVFVGTADGESECFGESLSYRFIEQLIAHCQMSHTVQQQREQQIECVQCVYVWMKWIFSVVLFFLVFFIEWDISCTTCVLSIRFLSLTLFRSLYLSIYLYFLCIAQSTNVSCWLWLAGYNLFTWMRNRSENNIYFIQNFWLLFIQMHK